ncbi:UDP-glucose 4-epimerase [Pseudoalteromonas sp. NBT06-2]|uniref:UDP-glucose 4-epimerase family protein n=1 Tax=Pseudoalteromonas sp. NBT06-2 TaxID=2025950 RepID=UPI000BA64992|nr:SDR family oxidoreductase [Pseudoalteromonas sp. NBT06-2]PAJ74461.1 UDP-glucose 4-epimerase [Pseudoalteromonas sp. NBT06-2]
MHNILLTGYTGFVGTHLLTELEASYNISLLGRKSLKHLSHDFYQAELNDKSDFSIALTNINTVIHCAARAHIMNDDSQDPLAEFREVNTYGTLNLAKQAASSGVKRFIYISSIKVNGESTESECAFMFNDKHAPQDPYGLSKSEAETQLFSLGKETGMEIVVIRPPLVFGEGVKANFAALLKLVGKGLPLPFRCITQNKRSMVSVYNLVDLIKTCIEHPNAANQVFLASDDDDLSTAEMVALMAKVQVKANFALPVPVWVFNLAGKVLNKQAVVNRLTGSLQIDIEHTKTTLNWQPPYSVEHGFKLAAKKQRN